jgi:enoyl-CoA hydratase/carnithine racemase
MTEPYVLRQDHGAIARLTMNAPASLNALSDGMMAALQATFDAIATDPAIRVVILAGAGKAFCAGHNLREMQAARSAPDKGAAAYLDLFARCGQLMQTITALPQPVIAEVHGIATAAGCQLVASCDLAVAATGTKFGVNGVNIGLFCSTPMVALTRNIPRKAAFEMLVTGAFIDCTRAQELGLINAHVAHEALAGTAMTVAETIAAKLGAVVQIGKKAFYAQAEMDVPAAYDYAGAVMATNMGLRDTDEGITAFLEKRKPDWA